MVKNVMVKRVVTVTSKRMVTIPVDLARKYNIEKSTKLEVIDTGEGILLIPITPLEKLFGIDDKKTAKEIISLLHQNRKREVKREE